MACTSPLAAWRPASGIGKLYFRPSMSAAPGQLQLPCGQCADCRLARSRQAAIRILHEGQMHEFNSFITLTYDEKHLPGARKDDFRYPGDLDYRDFQLFAKRLREKVRPFRHYTCGEYGEHYWRPHFHSCIFGIGFQDRYPWRKSSSGFQLYRSPLLESVWPFGQAEIGDLSFDSAAYVARYIMKKITGDKAVAHYERVNPFTGEIYSLTPEFVRMSNGGGRGEAKLGGIGKSWFEAFSSDVFPHDYVVINGKKSGVPRYYSQLYARDDPLKIAKIKNDRMVKALAFADDLTPARLRVRDICTRARLSTKVRTLE